MISKGKLEEIEFLERNITDIEKTISEKIQQCNELAVKQDPKEFAKLTQEQSKALAREFLDISLPFAKKFKSKARLYGDLTEKERVQFSKFAEVSAPTGLGVTSNAPSYSSDELISTIQRYQVDAEIMNKAYSVPEDDIYVSKGILECVMLNRAVPNTTGRNARFMGMFIAALVATGVLATTSPYWVPAVSGYLVTTAKIAQTVLVTLAASSKTAVAIAGELAKTAYSKIAIFLEAGMTNTKALMQILLSEGVPREIVFEFIEAAVETYLDEGTVEDFLLYGLVGAGIEIIAGSEVTQKVIKDGVEEILDSVNDIVLSPEARELRRNARKNAKEATEEHIERTVKTNAKDIAQTGAGSEAKGVEGAGGITRNQAELDLLATDPAIGNKITPKTIAERDVGLALESKGEVGKLIRDSSGSAEFIDTVTGQKWDVKAFNSKYAPKGYNLPDAMANINKSILNGENVMLDARNLNAVDLAELTGEIANQGLTGKVKVWP